MTWAYICKDVAIDIHVRQNTVRTRSVAVGIYTALPKYSGAGSVPRSD